MDFGAIGEEIRLLTEAAAALSPAGDERNSRIRKAAGYLRNGKIAETVRLCSAMRKDGSQAPIARLFLAIAFYKRGDLTNAVKRLRSILAAGSADPALVPRIEHLLAAFESQARDMAAPRESADEAGGEANGPVVQVRLGDREPGSVLNINWVVTPRCNFTCSYCNVYDNAASYPSLEQLTDAAGKIGRLNRPDVKFVLTGGEPTLHPGYIEFVEHVLREIPNVTSLRTETNLSRTPRFYRDLTDRMASHTGRLHFHASIHFEFTETGKFLDNARFLAAAGANVQVRVLAHPEQMAAVKRLAHEFMAMRGERLEVIVKTVRKHFGGEPDERYSQDDLSWLAEVYGEEAIERAIAVDFAAGGFVERQYFAANELIARRLNRFKGMGCYAGVEMLSIDSRGDVDAAVCFRGKNWRRYNIYRDADIPESMTQPVICPFASCGCPEDIAISKTALRH